MKHIRIFLIAIIVLYAACAANPVRAASPLKPNGLSLETGKIDEKNGRTDLYFASIIPQFSIGRVTTVLNLNYIATKNYKIRSGNHNFFVLDTLDYDGGDKFNLRYSEIKNLTLGSGFIVSNYRSDILGDVPLNLEMKLEVWDSPNSAGVVIDAIRCMRLGLDRGLMGTLVAPAAYFKKSPPIQLPDDEARERVEAFIRGEDNQTLVGTENLPKKVKKAAPVSGGKPYIPTAAK